MGLVRVVFAGQNVVDRLLPGKATKWLAGGVVAWGVWALAFYLAPRRRVTWTGAHVNPMHHNLFFAAGVGLGAAFGSMVIGSRIGRRYR